MLPESSISLKATGADLSKLFIAYVSRWDVLSAIHRSLGYEIEVNVCVVSMLSHNACVEHTALLIMLQGWLIFRKFLLTFGPPVNPVLEAKPISRDYGIF